MLLELPQLTFLALCILELGMVLAKHGERKTGISAEYNIWVTLISYGIIFGIIWWGGFFAA